MKNETNKNSNQLNVIVSLASRRLSEKAITQAFVKKLGKPSRHAAYLIGREYRRVHKQTANASN